MGIRGADQPVSIVEVVGTVGELFVGVATEVVTVCGGKAVRRFSGTRQDIEEHVEAAVVVFTNFARFLHVLQAGLGVAKIALQGFVLKEQLI